MSDLNRLSRQLEEHLRLCNDISKEEMENFFEALQEVPTDKYIEYPDLLMLLSYIDSIQNSKNAYVNNTLNAAFINGSIWCYIDNGDFKKETISEKMVDFVYRSFLNILRASVKRENRDCFPEEMEHLSYIVSFKLVSESLVNDFFEFC